MGLWAVEVSSRTLQSSDCCHPLDFETSVGSPYRLFQERERDMPRSLDKRHLSLAAVATLQRVRVGKTVEATGEEARCGRAPGHARRCLLYFARPLRTARPRERDAANPGQARPTPAIQVSEAAPTSKAARSDWIARCLLLIRIHSHTEEETGCPGIPGFLRARDDQGGRRMGRGAMTTR